MKKEWIGASWQRCKVHFMRNILSKITHREKKRFAEKLKQIWLQPDRKSAEWYGELFILEYEKKFPEAIGCLRNGLEDSLQFYEFEEVDKRKISSTNVLERVHREIRRRSRVVGIFPNRESYVRLITCYLMEYSEDWITERNYMKEEKVVMALEERSRFLETQAAC